MDKPDCAVGDCVQMKKPHACGSNAWRILRLGMDVRLRCEGCQHLVLLPRAKFEKNWRKTITENDTHQS